MFSSKKNTPTTNIQRVMFYLGKKVEDCSTGVEGIATSVMITANGNIMVAITPKASSDGVKKESHYSDSNLVNVIGEGVADKVCPFESEVESLLGHKCVDKVSGFTGIVTNAQYYISGCVQVLMESDKPNEKTGNVVMEYFGGYRVSIVKNKKDAKKEPKKVLDVKQTKTGGPSIPAVRKAC